MAPSPRRVAKRAIMKQRLGEIEEALALAKVRGLPPGVARPPLSVIVLIYLCISGLTQPSCWACCLLPHRQGAAASLRGWAGDRADAGTSCDCARSVGRPPGCRRGTVYWFVVCGEPWWPRDPICRPHRFAGAPLHPGIRVAARGHKGVNAAHIAFPVAAAVSIRWVVRACGESEGRTHTRRHIRALAGSLLRNAAVSPVCTRRPRHTVGRGPAVAPAVVGKEEEKQNNTNKVLYKI